MARIISHRGNLNGPDPTTENTTAQIDKAIAAGFFVEVDVWVVNDELFLGHDSPQEKIELSWLTSRASTLYIHCKNVPALEYFCDEIYANYFWHERDTLTLTSYGDIWVYPGKQPIKNSIAVMPEIHNDDVSACIAVCTDYPIRYNKELNHG